MGLFRLVVFCARAAVTVVCFMLLLLLLLQIDCRKKLKHDL